MENLESKVADAILERVTDVITIDGREYPIGPPTAGTLILVSELVASLPEVSETPENYYREVLRVAKDMSIIGRIVATLILGAKRIKEQRTVTVFVSQERKKWSWRKLGKVKVDTSVAVMKPEIDYIAQRIIDEVTNETLLKIVAKRLGMLQIKDFFELTTFLSGANRLKATREVETASGE